ncbi:hypothetical protein F8M41_025331 [Gigaspora margarita]|uniref:Uncharacterized protein n=1 Tax=Gigaspora margarita TaxID=4874 RepID=A0A8H4EVF4_GIGMA|nr:hypothetical protein F8M41_025331 [Gigaspora margarita]
MLLDKSPAIHCVCRAHCEFPILSVVHHLMNLNCPTFVVFFVLKEQWPNLELGIISQNVVLISSSIDHRNLTMRLYYWCGINGRMASESSILSNKLIKNRSILKFRQP